MNTPTNLNKLAADTIRSAAGIASGHGDEALANRLWEFETKLRTDGSPSRNFKVGDRVRVSQLFPTRKELGTIAAGWEGHQYPWEVKLDNGRIRYYLSVEMELV